MDAWLGILQFGFFMLVIVLVPAAGYHINRMLERSRLDTSRDFRKDLGESEERIERIERVLDMGEDEERLNPDTDRNRPASQPVSASA